MSLLSVKTPVGFSTRLMAGLVLCVFCLCLGPNLADAKCGLPRGVLVLMDDLYASTLNTSSINSGLADRLRRNAAKVDMTKVNTKLFVVGMNHSSDRINTLLKEAQMVDGFGRAMNPNILREKVKRAERLDAMVCKMEQINNDKARRVDASKSKVEKSSMPLVSVVENWGTTMRLVGLLSITALMIGLVVLVRFSYLWIHCLVNSRRACLIPAAIECGLDVIDGYVTILGRHGCRFQPANEGAFSRVEGLIGSRSALVVCNEKRFLVTLQSTHGRNVVALFRVPLSNQDQTGLLSVSKTAPRYVPKRKSGRQKSTRQARTA